MKAYILFRTHNQNSNEIVENVRKNYEYAIVQASSVYGWYDTIIELNVSGAMQLNEIIGELRHNLSNIDHFGTLIERTDKYEPTLNTVSAKYM